MNWLKKILTRRDQTQFIASPISLPHADSWNPALPLDDAFVNFPKRVYPDLKLKPVETESAVRFLFSAANPFFKSGQAFVKVSEVARIAGFYQSALTVNGIPTAFFGFWESTDVAGNEPQLFKDVEEWAKTFGAKQIFGPVNFNTFGRYRLQLDHFHEGENFAQEPTNPSFYPALLKGEGYTLAETYVTYRASRLDRLRITLEKLIVSSGTADKAYRFVPLSWDYLSEKKEELRLAINDMFSDNFAFSPIDAASFQLAFNQSFVESICAETSFVVEHASGRIAAICICHRNKKGSDENLFIKTVGIVKDYRGKGISLLSMIAYLLSKAQGLSEVQLCLMRKGNFPSLLMDGLLDEEKTYGLFKKTLSC